MSPLFALVTAFLTTCVTAAARPRLFLCGDSTMSLPAGRGDALLKVGWGTPLPAMMQIEVLNHAYHGASVRTFTRDGSFQRVVDSLTAGDWVVYQFGHNEFGSYRVSDKVSLDLEGPRTLEITNLKGEREVIRTYGAYLGRALEAAQAKGAHVLVLSHTPEVNYTPEQVTPRAPSRFVGAARDVGSSRSAWSFLDHNQVVADHLRTIGPAEAAKLYLDNRHMSATGAEMAATMFVQALLSSDLDLREYVKP